MQPYNIYPNDAWYVATFSADLKDLPVARTICGEPIVLFRTASGVIAALEDRCIHRGVPLAGGECVGEIIRCPYHGMEYDVSGICTKVPGQDRLPANARVRSFPVAEKDAMVWIWLGESEKADIKAIPSHHYHDDPGWAWSSIFLKVECDWQLLNDNLMDLTHLGYVHKQTIGGDPDAHTMNIDLKTTRSGNRVEVKRWLPNTNPPPFYSLGNSFSGKIDRWQEIDFTPGLVRIWSGGTDAGTGAYEGRRVGGVQFMGLHAVTPSTATSCYYHFTQSRNFKLDTSTELHKKIHDGALFTLLEDKTVLEAQQKRLLDNPERGLINIKWDIGPLQARRVIEERVATEAEQRLASAG
ncbi:Rieske 2Fe-2S domain-containing protein [Paraburkholderia silvatlantica]|uniref:aromatic ring-hydroxylating dioxygenase subunit alpha n=1 Tax=Paraburkholderia silvatlantica TaxID=321895 RepID=UPI00375119BC